VERLIRREVWECCPSRRSSRSVRGVTGTTTRLDEEGEEHTVQTWFIDIQPNLSITTPASRITTPASRLWGMDQKTRGIGARSPRSNKRSSYWATNRFRSAESDDVVLT
jgi:hypothetical protein